MWVQDEDSASCNAALGMVVGRARDDDVQGGHCQDTPPSQCRFVHFQVCAPLQNGTVVLADGLASLAVRHSELMRPSFKL